MQLYSEEKKGVADKPNNVHDGPEQFLLEIMRLTFKIWLGAGRHVPSISK